MTDPTRVELADLASVVDVRPMDLMTARLYASASVRERARLAAFALRLWDERDEARLDAKIATAYDNIRDGAEAWLVSAKQVEGWKAAQAQLKRAVEALRFYDDPTGAGVHPWPWTFGNGTALYNDRGGRARAIIAEHDDVP